MYSPYPQNFQQPMQIQDGGFVSVRNEMEARNFPVRYGNSVTFKDETAPYIYVKTMGFSQLDTPIFDKYRLVKEEPTMPNKAPETEDTYKSAFDELKGEIDAIKADIKALREELGNE